MGATTPEAVHCPTCGELVYVAHDLGSYEAVVQEQAGDEGGDVEATAPELYTGSCLTCSAALVWGVISNPGVRAQSLTITMTKNIL